MEKLFNESLSIKDRVAIRDYVKETPDDKISWADFNSLGYNSSNMNEDAFIEGIKTFKKIELTKSGVTSTSVAETPKTEVKEEPKPGLKEEPAESVSEPEAVETPSDVDLEKELEADFESADPEVDLGNDIHRGIYRIAKSQWPNMYNALERCKKKMGGEFSYKIVGESIVDQKQLYTSAPWETGPRPMPFWGDPIKIPVFNVKIVSRVKENNWEVVAICQHEKTQNGIVTVPINEDHEIPLELLHKDKIDCDHCHTNRDRTFGAIVYNNVSKEFRMVGKSCLKEYTGIDPTELLALSHVYSVARHWDPQNSSRKNYFDLLDTLVIASAATKLFGYVKPIYLGTNRWGASDYEESETCTRRIVREISQSKYEKAPSLGKDKTVCEVIDYISNHSAELEDFATKAIEYVGGLDNLNNEFQHNIQVVLSGRLVSEKQLGLVCSFPSMYARFVADQENNKALGDFKPNNEFYPAKIGEKVVIKDILKVVKGGQTRTGSYIISIFTNDGYEFTAFANEADFPESWDDVARVSGKIYRFNEFRGKKSTTLNNVKFTTNSELYFQDDNAPAPALLGNIGDKITVTPVSVNAGPEKSVSFSYNRLTYYSTMTLTDAFGNKVRWNCYNWDTYTNPNSLIGKKITGTIKHINKDENDNIECYVIGGRVKVDESKAFKNAEKRLSEGIEDLLKSYGISDLSQLVDDAMEDDDDLLECWQNAVEKYKSTWDSKDPIFENVDSISEALLKITPHYADLHVKDEEDGDTVTSCLGLTSHVRSMTNPIEVAISNDTIDLSNDDFYDVLLHEMCHAASYYSCGDIDLHHDKDWAYYSDILNTKCGYHIVANATDIIDKIFESKSSSGTRLTECHFAELPRNKNKKYLNRDFDKAINDVLENASKEKPELTPEESDLMDEYQAEKAYQDQLDYESCLDMYHYDEDGFCDGFPR